MKQFQRSRVPPAENKAVHWLVRWIWNEINRQHTSQEDVAKRAGTSSSGMRKWRKGDRSPRLYDIEAIINVLGYKLRIESTSREFEHHDRRPFQSSEGMLSLPFSGCSQENNAGTSRAVRNSRRGRQEAG